MDSLVVSHEGKDNKTVIRNITRVCLQLHVPVQWVAKYLCTHLGTTEEFREDKLYLNGEHLQNPLQKKLDNFISNYVICEKCKVPELNYIYNDTNEKKPDITCKCRACSHIFQLRLLDKKMVKVILQFIPDKKGETVVKSEKDDTKKSDRRKEREKVIAKISDQNYYLGSDELNKIVNTVRAKYNECSGESVQFAEYLSDIYSTSLSKNEFLKAYVLWNGIVDINTAFEDSIKYKVRLIKAIMLKQKNISRFQTYLLVTICYWLAWKKTKNLSPDQLNSFLIYCYQLDIIVEANYIKFLDFCYESGEKFESDLKENYNKKYLKRGLQRMEQFYTWVLSILESTDYSEDSVKEELNLDRNPALKIQEESIRRTTQAMIAKEKEMREAQIALREKNESEKVEVELVKEEDVDIDDI